MKKLIFVGAALLVWGCGAAAADQPNGASASSPQDVADIRHVLDDYHHAVVTHDGQGVAALFLDQGGNLVSVLSDKAYGALKAKRPLTKKVRISTVQDYAKFVSGTRSALDPRHSDTRIVSDGTVASVYFHFDYVIDGKVENRGDEAWQLVKTADGWRIVAIIYSSHPGAA